MHLKDITSFVFLLDLRMQLILLTHSAFFNGSSSVDVKRLSSLNVTIEVWVVKRFVYVCVFIVLLAVEWRRSCHNTLWILDQPVFVHEHDSVVWRHWCQHSFR